MSSVDPNDLTAAAKIRNVAIEHFVRDGFSKANLRAIAAEAGVSIGLIFHHFTNKAGLRAACDEHVLRVGRERVGSGMRNLLAEYLSDPEEYRLQVRYIARAIAEDSPAAHALVDTMVGESEELFAAGVADGSVRPTADPRARAVLHILISLAVITMPPPLARALGHEDFGPEVLRRLTAPTYELYTTGLYTDANLPAAAEAAWEHESPERDET